MKPLSQTEIQSLLLEIELLRGSQLQEIVSTPAGLSLGHYVQPPGQRGQTLWLHIDPQQNVPFFSRTSAPPPAPKATKSPLHLFLVAHAKGRSLSSLRLLADIGRAVEFTWGALDSGPDRAPCRLEFRMIPSKVNLIATCEPLSISFRKVVETTTTEAFRSFPQGGGRPPEVLRAEWSALSQGSKSSEGTPAERAARLRAKLVQDVEKKEIALVKMQAQLAERDPAPLEAIAVWIRDHWSLEIPSHLLQSVDNLDGLLQSDIPRTLAAFHALIKKRKAQQGSERLGKLQGEITRLKQLLLKSDDELLSLQRAQSTRSTPQGRVSKAVGKRLDLSDSQFVVVGRSAAENLQILRNAQPWDLWLHLKDLPSAHGIVRRPRGRAVSDADLVLAFHFVLKMTPKVARHLQAGDRIEGIVAECRFVSPLKGDHLGRVTVQQSRTILLKYDPQKLTRS